jgi:hypothetical protein
MLPVESTMAFRALRHRVALKRFPPHADVSAARSAYAPWELQLVMLSLAKLEAVLVRLAAKLRKG